MVKNYDSTQLGAPVLSGTAGAMRAVIKACLIDGFGAGAVATLVVAAGVATATYAGAHPFRVGSVALFAGSTPTALNGEKPILSFTSSSVTFAAPGVPDGAATGSITSKMAGAGWVELFPAALANVLALKPSALEATGCVLRLDDTGTLNSRVRAYESMTDINTGYGPNPLESQVSGGLYWPKSSVASTLARPWFVVADARSFYLGVAPAGGDRYTLLSFGDIASLKSGDPYGCLVTGNQADQTGITAVPDGCLGYSRRASGIGAYLARSHTGIGQALSAQCIGSHHNGPTAAVYAGAAGYSLGTYPNGPNNGLMSGELEVYAQGIRGTLPGLLHPVQDLGGSFATGLVIDGTDDLAGRRLLAVRVGPPTGAVLPGTVLIDLTGPWAR